MKKEDVIGGPAPLPDHHPTNLDVLKFISLKQEELKTENGSCPSNDSVFLEVAEEIVQFYQPKPYILCISPRATLKKRIIVLHKRQKSTQSAKKDGDRLKKFLTDMSKRFDIGVGNFLATAIQSTSDLQQNCQVGGHNSAVLQKTLDDSNNMSLISNTWSHLSQESNSMLSTKDSTTADPDYNPIGSTDDRLPLQYSFENFLGVCIRHGVSLEGRTQMLNALCMDLPQLHGHKATDNVVRTMCENMRKMEVDLLSEVLVKGIYFDGKQDKNCLERSGKRNETTTISNYTMVGYPGSQRLGHFEPDNSEGRTIAAEMLNWLKAQGIVDQHIVLVGTDGTAANTGYKGGAIRQLEEILRRRLQRVICLYHHIELPFRHLFILLDGKSTGPKSFQGPVGKMLAKDLENRPISEFEKIQCLGFPRISDEVLKTLSSDHQYIYSIIIGIIDGHIPDSLVTRKMGPLNHARWLTLACRILRYYISKPEPQHFYTVEKMTKYIIYVYYRVFADIKLKPTLSDGARHILSEMKYLDDAQLTRKEREVVFHIIEINGYMAHPENLILALLSDKEDIENRKFGLMMVRQIRSKTSVYQQAKIRYFLLPKINPFAKTLRDLIYIRSTPYTYEFMTIKGDWQQITEPPLLMNMTWEDIREFKAHPYTCDYPSHTQDVERNVKLTSKVSGRLVGNKRKVGEGLIIAKSRETQPSKKRRRINENN